MSTRIDANRLRDELSRYDPELPVERAWTPPSSWYLDPDLFELERRTVFRSSWLPAARTAQLETPGSYVAGTVGGEPFVLTRDHDGVLRGFYNVCRHHAALVADGTGCADALTCPYHGWSYRLDGRLRSAPRLGAIAEFDRDEFGLVPLHVSPWRELVWVHLGEPTGDAGADLRELDRRLDACGDAPLVHVATRSYDIQCNWKVFVDNYLDGGYHVPRAHPGLASQLDMRSYRTELFDRYSIQSCAGTGEAAAPDIGEGPDASHGPDPGAVAGRIGAGAVYAWLYPNFMLNRYGPAMDTNAVIPIAHDRTRVVIEFYFEQPARPGMREFIERSLASSELTQREDIALCESVQRGIRSSAYDRGRLAPGLEHGEHHFHRLLAADLRRGL